MTDAASIRIPFDSVPVLVRVAGPQGAPLVIFAHPFPLHGACWEPQMDAAVQAGYRALAFDAPGFGGSPTLGRKLRMEDVAQIMTLAMEAQHAPRAVLVGSSMGGYAVQAFAREHGDRLAGAVLIGTKASADTPEAREKRESQALTALGKGAAAVTAQLVPNLVHESHPQALARAQELAAGATAQGLADALRGMAERPDSGPSLKKWAAAALVVGGEYDKVIPPAEIDALAAGISNSAKVMLPAGHLVFLEKPAEVNKLMIDFLKACEAANAWSRRASDRKPVLFV